MIQRSSLVRTFLGATAADEEVRTKRSENWD
jgi:hypothetical protein